MKLRTRINHTFAWMVSATLIFNPLHPALTRIAVLSDFSSQKISWLALPVAGATPAWSGVASVTTPVVALNPQPPPDLTQQQVDPLTQFLALSTFLSTTTY